ncbi:MAG: hypothetical protein Ta2B_01160 [Termitinemataceae bacterium]|nr:MAG: hypothetical protein Ta2B_01160 [Termitinemataceae bacterium]
MPVALKKRFVFADSKELLRLISIDVKNIFMEELVVKKKVLVLCSALFVVCAIDAFSLGIGLRGGWGGDWGGALLITPSTSVIDGMPLHFGISFGGWGDGINIGVTADYWFFRPNISGPVYFYVGAGLYAWFALATNGGLGLGFRLPIGVDFDFGKVDLFLEVVPQPQILGLYSGGGVGFWWHWGGAIGARIWL